MSTKARTKVVWEEKIRLLRQIAPKKNKEVYAAVEGAWKRFHDDPKATLAETHDAIFKALDAAKTGAGDDDEEADA